MTPRIPIPIARFWAFLAILVMVTIGFRTLRSPLGEIRQIRSRLTAQGMAPSLEALENQYAPDWDRGPLPALLFFLPFRLGQMPDPSRSPLTADQKRLALTVLASSQRELRQIHDTLNLTNIWTPFWKTNIKFFDTVEFAQHLLLQTGEAQVDSGEIAAGISSVLDAFKLVDVPETASPSSLPSLKTERCKWAVATVESLVNVLPLASDALVALDSEVELHLERHDIARAIEYSLLFTEADLSQDRTFIGLNWQQGALTNLRRASWNLGYLLSGRRWIDRLDLLRANAALWELSKRSTSELKGCWTLPVGGIPLPLLRPKWDPFGNQLGIGIFGWDWIRLEAILRTRALVTHVGLAVERYRRDHEENLPESLDALVPRYLSAVPADPFGAGPLHYHQLPVGFRVYSIGSNLHDDGGVPMIHDDAFDAPYDLTFTVKR